MAQRLDKRMRSQISPCISSCRVVRGTSLGEILKTKNTGKAISGHFALRLKSQIYLNYVFEVGRASSVGCAYHLVKQTVAGSILTPSTFFRGDLVMKNKIYDHSLPSADSRRAAVSYWQTNVH